LSNVSVILLLYAEGRSGGIPCEVLARTTPGRTAAHAFAGSKMASALIRAAVVRIKEWDRGFKRIIFSRIESLPGDITL